MGKNINKQLPPPLTDRIKFDIQRFADSVSATASSE